MHLLVPIDMSEFEADLNVFHSFEFMQLRFDLGLLSHYARNIRRCRGRPERQRTKEEKKIGVYASDVDGRTRTETERIDGRRSEDLSVSVMEVSEFSDGQLFDGRYFGLRRYSEARHGSDLSGSHRGGGVT